MPSTVDNMTSGTYVFSPNPDQCATESVTIAIEVTPLTTPTFKTINAICEGGTAPELTLISIEGITGTWLPAVIDNTTTGTYTFTPDPGQCASPTTITVVVDPAEFIPTFDVIAPICAGSSAATLPESSNEGITGTWFPAVINNMMTTTYSFTPDPGQCAIPTSLEVVVNGQMIDVFGVFCNQPGVEPIDLALLLPGDIAEGGQWTDVDNSGALNNSVFSPEGLTGSSYTFEYTVMQDGCVTTATVEMTFSQDECGIVLPCGSVAVYNAFSPNNDGVNEVFMIENLQQFDCYPTNIVRIYNRYGVLVYEAKQYDNDGTSFKGISEGRANVGDELPTGTYFYVVQYTTTEGSTVSLDGYLYLSR